MARAFADIAFTPAVRAQQNRMGSAAGYDKFLADEAVRSDELGSEEASFIANRDGFYQAHLSQSSHVLDEPSDNPCNYGSERIQRLTRARRREVR